MQSRNLAARAGRWSAQHRRSAILGWLLFVVLATVLGGKVGQNNIDQSASGNGESRRGDMIIEAADFPEQAGEQVLIQGKGSMKAGDPAVTAAGLQPHRGARPGTESLVSDRLAHCCADIAACRRRDSDAPTMMFTTVSRSIAVLWKVMW